MRPERHREPAGVAALRARLGHVYWGRAWSRCLAPADARVPPGCVRQPGSLWEIARKTSDPERALRNLLERDQMFTERLREETKRLELRVIEVDTTITEDALAEQVTEALGC